MAMDRKIKKLWVDELRGGDFEQGKNQLRKGNACCCLGVLCELAWEQGVPVVIRKYPDDTYNYDGVEGTLPQSVYVWAGLHDNNPRVGDKLLSQLNDHTELGFSGIAEWIEKYL